MSNSDSDAESGSDPNAGPGPDSDAELDPESDDEPGSDDDEESGSDEEYGSDPDADSDNTSSHEIYTGDCNSICSVTEFLDHMPESAAPKCREFARTSEPHQLRVFYHPTATEELNRDFNRAAAPPATAIDGWFQPVQDRIKSSLLALKYNQAESIFIQFWTPRKTLDGRVMLSVLGEPFGMGNLCNGFCKYRYISMKRGILLEAGNVGPVGRVFSRKYPEHCASIESYSMEEFPMRDHAKFCGAYVAMPVFNCDILPECSGPVGVLEVLSRESRSVLYPVIWCQLQSVSLFCTHVDEPPEINQDDGGPLKSALLSLTKKLKLPLVQIWTPFFSKGAVKFTRLIHFWKSSSDPFYGNVCLDFDHGIRMVDIGKGLIGRAWEQRKTCFLGETSQLSISDYPLVHVTRSSRLTSCFDIPLQSIGPFSVVVEIFLLPQNNCHHDYVGVGDVLKSLLSDMAKISQSYQDFPFQINENKEFCVQYSHSDEEKFLYFDICEKFQTSVESSRECSANGEAEILGSNIREREVYPAENVKVGPSTPSCIGKGSLPSNKRKEVENIQQTLRTQCVEPVDHVIQDLEISTFPNKKAKQNEAPGNDEINRAYRIIVEACYNGDLAKFFLSSSSGIEELHRELHKRFKLEADKFQIKYKDNVGRLVILSCDEDLLFHMETSKTPGQTVLELSILPAAL